MGTVGCDWRRNLRESLPGKVSVVVITSGYCGPAATYTYIHANFVVYYNLIDCHIYHHYRNVSTGDSLAVKQLYLVDGSDQEVEFIRKEIKVMWKLDHQNIVRYCSTLTLSLCWLAGV